MLFLNLSEYRTNPYSFLRSNLSIQDSLLNGLFLTIKEAGDPLVTNNITSLELAESSIIDDETSD